MPPEDTLNPLLDQSDPEDIVIDESTDEVIAIPGDLSLNESSDTFSGDLTQLSDIGDLPAVMKQARDNPTKKGGLLNFRVLTDRSPEAAATFEKGSQQVISDYFKEMGQIKKDTGQEASALQQLWGTAKAMGRQFAVGARYAQGLDEKDIEALNQAQIARQYIGDLTDDFDIRFAMTKGAQFKKDLDEGKEIAKPDGDLVEVGMKLGELPAVGMTLGRAQEYLNDLKDDKTKAFGTAGLRNFAVKTGDAFVPFVNIGDIIIDEKNPDQVAKRAALTEAINEVITTDYLKSTLAGSVLGSLGQFALGTGLARKLIQGPKAASATAYGILGASQSLKSDKRDLPWYDRLVDVGTEAITLYGAERVGESLEQSLENTLARRIAKQSISKNAPLAGAAAQTALGATAMTLGEFASEEVEAILRGQDPVATAAESFAASAGAGLGMRSLGFRKNYVNLQQKVNLFKAIAFREQIGAVLNDPNLSQEDKNERLQDLRGNIGEDFVPLFDTVFDGVTKKAALDRVDKSVSPQTHQELTKQVGDAGAKVDEEANKLAEKLADDAETKRTQPPAPSVTEPEAGAPIEVEGEEDIVGVPNFEFDVEKAENSVLIYDNLADRMSRNGEKTIRFKASPQTEALARQLDGRGDVYTKLDEATGDLLILGVRTGDKDSPVWLGEDDPKEAFSIDKEEALDRIRNTKKYTESELDDIYERYLSKATSVGEIAQIERQYIGETPIEAAQQKKIDDFFALDFSAQNNPKIRFDLAEADRLDKEAEESVPEQAQILKQQATALRQRANALKAEVFARVSEEKEKDLDEKEADADRKLNQGRISLSDTLTIPELNPEGETMTYLKNTPVSEREINRELFWEVFDKNNESTVKMLKDIGAIDENTGDVLLTAAETVEAFIKAKQGIFESRKYAAYKQFDFAANLMAALRNRFQEYVRKGKTPFYLSTALDQLESKLIEKAWPRLKQQRGLMVPYKEEMGAGEGETAGEEAVGRETERQEAAAKEKSVSDQVDENLKRQRTETDQLESKRLLLEEVRSQFRESLPTDEDKAIFDSTYEGGNLKTSKQVAAEINKSQQTVVRRQLVLRKQFQTLAQKEFQARQKAGTLPVAQTVQVQTPQGAVTQVVATPKKPVTDRKMDAQDISDSDVNLVIKQIEEALALDYITPSDYNMLLNAPTGSPIVGITVSRDADNAIKIKSYLQGMIAASVSEETDPANLLADTDVQLETFADSLSQQQLDGFRQEIEAAVAKFNQSGGETNVSKKIKAVKDLRDTLISVTKRAQKEAGYVDQQEEETIKEANRAAEQNSRTRKPGVQRSTALRTETAPGKPEAQPRADAGPAKAGEPKPTGAVQTGRLAGVKPGGEPAGAAVQPVKKGTPTPKKFVFTRGQGTSQRDPSVIKKISQGIKNILKKEQLFDLGSIISQLETTAQRAFGLFAGPGTGKTYVLCGAAKHYMNDPKKRYKVVYASTTQALGMDPKKDWRRGKFAGTLAKAVGNEAFDIPTILRGTQEKPIDKDSLSPDHMLVTTHEHLEDLLPFMDENTILIIDEHQELRNVHKAKQKGKGESRILKALEASMKAGRVIFASGSPIETPDQLFSLQRLGVMDNIPGKSLDEKKANLMTALGMTKVYRAGKTKYTWELAPEYTQEQADEMLDRLIADLAAHGYLSSRSLSLEGVKVNRVDVTLPEEAKERVRFIEEQTGLENLTGRMMSSMILEQRRAVEEFKIDLALDNAEKDIDSGRKVVFVVNSVNESDIQNVVTRENILSVSATADIVRTKLNAINERRVKEGKNPIVFAEYHGESDTNATALDSFNKQNAQLLITTTSKGGVGIEMDDKVGDSPRSMYIITPPLSAIEIVQVIYRIFRLDTASDVAVKLYIGDTQADQWALDRLSRRLRNLETVMGAGFSALDVNSTPILSRQAQAAQELSPFQKLQNKIIDLAAEVNENGYPIILQYGLFSNQILGDENANFILKLMGFAGYQVDKFLEIAAENSFIDFEKKPLEWWKPTQDETFAAWRSRTGLKPKEFDLRPYEEGTTNKIGPHPALNFYELFGVVIKEDSVDVKEQLPGEPGVTEQPKTELRKETPKQDNSSAVTELIDPEDAAAQTNELLDANGVKLDVVAKPIVESLVESGLVVESGNDAGIVVRFDTMSPDADARAGTLEARAKALGFTVAFGPGQAVVSRGGQALTAEDGPAIARLFTGEQTFSSAPTSSTPAATTTRVDEFKAIVKRLFPSFKNNIVIDPTSPHALLAVPGAANGEDTIVVNPDELASVLDFYNLRTPEEIETFLVLGAFEEVVHIKSFEILRADGKDPGVEAERLGLIMPASLRQQVASLYYANRGLSLDTPGVQKLVNAMAGNRQLVALEYVRQLVDLKVLGMTTEEGLLMGLSGEAAQAVKRRTTLFVNSVYQTSQSKQAGIREAIMRWLNALLEALKVVQKDGKLVGLANVENIVDQVLKNTISSLQNLNSDLTPVEAPFKGVSPNQARPFNDQDKYDLRLHRQIELYLDFDVNQSVFGVRAAMDDGRTVDTDAWLTALDAALSNGIITKIEYDIFRGATEQVMGEVRTSLRDVNSAAMDIWTALSEEQRIAIPREALLIVSDAPTTQEGAEPVESPVQAIIDGQDTVLKDFINQELARVSEQAGPNDDVESDQWKFASLMRILADFESLGESRGGVYTGLPMDPFYAEYLEWKSLYDKAMVLRATVLGKPQVAEGAEDVTVPLSLSSSEVLFANIAQAGDFQAVIDALAKIPVQQLQADLVRLGLATNDEFTIQGFADFGNVPFSQIPEYAKRNFINGKIYSAFKTSPQNAALKGEVTFESKEAFDQGLKSLPTAVPLILYTRKIPLNDLIENLVRVGVIPANFTEGKISLERLDDAQVNFRDALESEQRFELERAIRKQFEFLTKDRRLEVAAPGSRGLFVSELDNAAYMGAVAANETAKARKIFENVAVQFARSYPDTGYVLTPDIYLGYRADGSKLKNYAEVDYKTEITVVVKFSDGNVLVDGMNGLNFQHALERARRNWPGAVVLPSAITPADPIITDAKGETVPLTLRFRPDPRIHRISKEQRGIKIKPTFRVALTLPNTDPVYSSGKSNNDGLVKTVIKLFEGRGGQPVLFEGRLYSEQEWRLLYHDIKKSPAYSSYFRRVSQLNAPAPGSGPKINYSKAVNRLADLAPEGSLQDYMRANSEYQEQPREVLEQKARQFVETYGLEESLNLLLSDRLSVPMSLEVAIAMQVVSDLQAQSAQIEADGLEDVSAQEKMADLSVFLMKKYASEAGRSLNYLKIFEKVAGNPVSLQLMVDKILNKATEFKVEPFLPELNEISLSLEDATVRAVGQLTELPGVNKLLKTLKEVAPKDPSSPRVSELIAVINRANRNPAVVDALNRFKRRIGAASPAGRPNDEIPVDKNAVNDLADAILAHIMEVNAVDPNAVDSIFEDRNVLNAYLARMGLNQNQIDLYGAAAALVVRNRLEMEAQNMGNAPVFTPPTVEQAERGYQEEQKKTRGRGKVKLDPDKDMADAIGEILSQAFAREAARSGQEPKVEEFFRYLARIIKPAMREQAALKEKFPRPIPPSAAQNVKALISNFEVVQRAWDLTRDKLLNNYPEDVRETLENLIDKSMQAPVSQSQLKAALTKLNTIGGESVNIRQLIRQSDGDISTFTGKLRDLLLKETNLSEAKRLEITRFLSKSLESLVEQERKRELANILARYEKNKERKTRKIRGVLQRLMDAANLGALRNDAVFQVIRDSIGLPDVSPEVRAEIEAKIKKIAKMPEGSIRMRGLNDLFGFIKTSAPIAWGDLIVDLQTFNLLASISTLGINTWGGTLQVTTDVFLMSSMNSIEGLFKKTGTGGGFRGFARLFQVALPKWLGGTGEAWTALNIVRKGDLSAAADMTVANNFSTVNTFQAMKKKFENAKRGRLPIEDAYQEISLPLGQSMTISLNPNTVTGNVMNAALTPAVWVSQGMAMGDAFNKMGAKKAMEIAEAYRIATTRYTEQADVDAEVIRLLNYTPEARERAIAQAEVEAKTFGLNASQKLARIEEILEQGRDEDGQRITEMSTEFARRATYTNDFEGSLGKLMAGLQRLAANGHWTLRTIFKFLKTASSLTNEALNWMPAWSLKRLLVGSGTFTEKNSKYRRQAAQPGTNAFNIQLAKVIIGHIGTMGLLAILRAFGAWGPDREEDPAFMVHYNGPEDAAQRKAWTAAGAKPKSIQIGRFADGTPKFISWESLPYGVSGFLLPVAIFVEASRYSKRSEAEATMTAALGAIPMVASSIVDLAFMNGMRRVFNAVYPRQPGAQGKVQELADFVGNLAGTIVVPGYATLRDLENVVDAFRQSSAGRPAKIGITGSFLRSIPFAASIPEAAEAVSPEAGKTIGKVLRPDLSMLGTPVKIPLLRGIPIAKRFFSLGADINSEDPETRVFALLAAKRVGILWSPSELSDVAVREAQLEYAAGRMSPQQFQKAMSDAVFLGKTLSSEEKYDWMAAAGPDIVNVLSNPKVFDAILNTQDPNVAKELVSRVLRPIKRKALIESQVKRLVEKQAELLPENQ
jgi:hypothetical protein